MQLHRPGARRFRGHTFYRQPNAAMNGGVCAVRDESLQADETVVGAARSCWLGHCFEHMPNDPLRCGLNSTTSHTRCFVLTGAARQFPQGVGTGVALQLHGLAFSVCYLPSCGLCAMGGWVGAQIFLSTVSRRLAWRGLCGSDKSLQPDETVVGAAHSCYVGHCSVLTGRSAGAWVFTQ